ncbi:fumarylacetoacetate hydrolase family protein [Pseudomonas sp. TUM22785]|uniref:fumarylacetoacetate hydrolase family protein n=1 Tax=Pseudomonas sp. TUM22785 TaxID=3019098 RepID=UPI0023069644|nr:fumarylacetoacetate hydrolase family protein [Pseudomonas sp. TUM22785]WCD77992.1 fumarylacetoacetate hydrolase family protein [Pseudomonas sp. TUM22785]
MKLIRFARGETAPEFGLVIGEHAISFASLQASSGRRHTCLDSSDAYLAALPQSELLARELQAWAEAHLESFSAAEKPRLNSVRLHAPIEVRALFDLGLTPRHLSNSGDTLVHYEKDNPDTGPLLAAFRKMLLAPRAKPSPGVPERLSYYKGNLNSIVGDDVEVPWPVYTSRLDIEPELAVVYGNAHQPVAGYCIFNDISARDVQALEIIGGFCLTKDMTSGNQLGPWLVTADEVGNPLDLAVHVAVDGAPRFQGSTREISHPVEDVFAWLGLICPLQPGSVMGMGTIPDCTGLDHDDFLDPGADIRISIERLGTLRCRFGEPKHLLPSRWPLRQALQKYRG